MSEIIIKAAVDGYVGRSVSNPNTWPQLINWVGTIKSYATGFAMFEAAGGYYEEGKEDLWELLARGMMTFPLDEIGDLGDLTIVAAKLRLYGIAKYDDSNLLPTTNVYQADPAANDALVNADYGRVYDNPLSSPVEYGNWPTGDWIEFELNNAGITLLRLKLLVDKFVSFAIRNANYDVAKEAPSWIADAVSGVQWAGTEIYGEDYTPQLILTIGTTPPPEPLEPIPPVATLQAADFQEFILDFSEREIYNDIRAECDIEEILELRPDATPEFFDSYEISETFTLPPDSCTVHTITAPSEHQNAHWIDALISNITLEPLYGLTQEDCEAIEAGTPYQGQWANGVNNICVLPPRWSQFRLLIQGTEQNKQHLTVQIYNNYPYYSAEVTVTAKYLALNPEKRYIKLRSINGHGKYGRRTMNLSWPLGIHPLTMKNIIDDKCQRYSEPVCMVNTTLYGKTEELALLILMLRINDKVQIIHPGLDLDDEFFVNRLDVSHDINTILEGRFELEQVRDEERYGYGS